MELNILFDTRNNIESINGSSFLLGTNFINFISSNIDKILSVEVISSLSEKNYKEILFKISTASNDVIIPEIIITNVLVELSNGNIDILQIKRALKDVLKSYNKFKELTEFCYFNSKIKETTPLQNYIYYLNNFKIKKIVLKQVISSFGLNPVKKSEKLLENDDVSLMVQKNYPFFYYSYECSTIDEYMTASFLKLIENNYLILKCENCGKYFIAYNRANTLYCDRTSPQNSSKSCKQYGKEQKWLGKTKDENDWYSLYRKTYQSFQKKAIRNPEHKESKQNFDNFRMEGAKWKKNLKKGIITEEEMISWLKNIKNK